MVEEQAHGGGKFSLVLSKYNMRRYMREDEMLLEVERPQKIEWIKQMRFHRVDWG